jgi:hypothetical protein
MIDKITTLKELLAKVEAGNWDILRDGYAPFEWNSGNEALAASRAYHGSVDAFLKLKACVLPDWHLNLALDYCHLIPPHNNGDQDACSGYHHITSRAGLIAIIEALIWEAKL